MTRRLATRILEKLKSSTLSCSTCYDSNTQFRGDAERVIWIRCRHYDLAYILSTVSLLI